AGQSAIHDEGFGLDWLLNVGNQSDLNRLRHAFCCNPSVNWYGCSTAGVWAEGDERNAAEVRQSKERYSGPFSHFYQSVADAAVHGATRDRKSTRLNSSHVAISYAVFCLKKKTKTSKSIFNASVF